MCYNECCYISHQLFVTSVWCRVFKHARNFRLVSKTCIVLALSNYLIHYWNAIWCLLKELHSSSRSVYCCWVWNIFQAHLTSFWHHSDKVTCFWSGCRYALASTVICRLFTKVCCTVCCLMSEFLVWITASSWCVAWLKFMLSYWRYDQTLFSVKHCWMQCSCCYEVALVQQYMYLLVVYHGDVTSCFATWLC